MKEVSEAIYTKLAADSRIAAAVGTRIFQGMAPQTTTYPLIIINPAGGSFDNSTPTDMADLRYMITANSRVSIDEVETIAGYVQDALHKTTLSVSGWTNYSTSVERESADVDYVKPTGKIKGSLVHWFASRQFRICLSK